MNLSFSIYDVKALSDEQLFALVGKTLQRFSILKQIYNKEALDIIIKKRFYHDNYLLWILASQHPYAFETCGEISKSLHLLKYSGGIEHFKEKLMSTSEITLNDYLLELEFAAYYKEKGFAIELEPKMSAGGKNPDFKVISHNYDIFFEAKHLSEQEMKNANDFEIQLAGALGKVKEKLVFDINRDLSISVGDIPQLKAFVLQKLHQNEELDHFPTTYYFPNENEPKAELVIRGRPNKLEFGYLATIGYMSALEITNRERILKKIASKVSQLPKDGHNVVVVQSGDIFTDEEHIMDALFGAETYRYHFDGRLEPFRKGDRVFSQDKNTRISAVIYFVRQWIAMHLVKQKIVFHNPYANKPIPTEFFKDINVRQFGIIERTPRHVTMDWL